MKAESVAHNLIHPVGDNRERLPHVGDEMVPALDFREPGRRRPRVAQRGEEGGLPGGGADLREGVAQVVDLAPLMHRLGELALDGGREASMFVAHHVLHTLQAALVQVLEHAAP